MRSSQPTASGFTGTSGVCLHTRRHRRPASGDLHQDLVGPSGVQGDSRLFTWIYRIATNETLNWLHKQKVRSMLRFESLDSTMADKVDDDPYFNGNEAQRLLFKAIARLPQKQKAVFTMRYFDELSYEEISEILGTSVGALKASYHFAAEKIRSEIESGIKP